MKYVVVMRDPVTGEEKNLTMPSAKYPTENSCRRFKAIGMKNIFVQESKRKTKVKPFVDRIAMGEMPESEEEWANQLVKNIENN